MTAELGPELGKVFQDLRQDIKDFVDDVEIFKQGGFIPGDKKRWWFAHRYILGTYFFVYDQPPSRVRQACRELVGDDEELFQKAVAGVEYLLGYPLEDVLLNPIHTASKELHSIETIVSGLYFEGEKPIYGLARRALGKFKINMEEYHGPASLFAGLLLGPRGKTSF